VPKMDQKKGGSISGSGSSFSDEECERGILSNSSSEASDGPMLARHDTRPPEASIFGRFPTVSHGMEEKRQLGDDGGDVAAYNQREDQR